MSRGLIFKNDFFLLIQVGGETENEGKKADRSLLQTRIVTQNPLTHNMSMWPNNEGR